MQNEALLRRNYMKVGIIGYGSMGKMLFEKFVGNHEMLVANRTPEKIADLKDCTICSNTELAAAADVVIMCVRPVDIKKVMEEVKPVLKPETILISLNGSVTFESMSKVMDRKLCKVIPSLTAEIDRAQTLVCHNDLMTTENRVCVKELFECMGDVIELPENEMGMGSEFVSCMPGFIASIFDVICNSAKAHTNIPDDQIVSMVLKTMIATGELMLAKDMTFEDVVNRVATKGGITQEGTKVVYEQFPKTADDLFNNTLEKRRVTAKNAEDAFNASGS